MATRAAIGMMQADGSVKAIYLHWDGYPGHAGAVLGGWYKTDEQVTALLDLGDLSEIEPDLEKCVAYHRDRHEPYREPSVYADREEFQNKGKADFGADYLYLYENGKWSVYGLYNDSDWNELDVIINPTKEN